MPQRLQLSRRKGYRKPPGAVVVARPTKWGNPYRASDYPRVRLLEGEAIGVPAAERRRFAVVDFKAAVKYGIGRVDYPSTEDIRRELAGKDLACWCPLPEPGAPDICHAAVLLDIANGGDH